MGLVVLVACVNVGFLLLARAASRASELATRLALGASRRHLAAALRLEGLVLALASAGVAIVLSFWSVDAVKMLLPPGLARVSQIAVDGRLLGAVIAAAVIAAMVFSTAPAWFGGRTDLVGVMKTGGPSISAGGRHRRSLSSFLVANVAFVTLLLVASTLVVTSFVLITTADPGFDRRNVVSIWYHRPLGPIAAQDQPAALITARAEMLRRARAVPDVSHAASTNSGAPLSGSEGGARLLIPGFGVTDGDDMPRSLPVPRSTGTRTHPGIFRPPHRRPAIQRSTDDGVGVIAIGIGAIGVFGTMAFVVAPQTRAIGLRMALGRRRRDPARRAVDGRSACRSWRSDRSGGRLGGFTRVHCLGVRRSPD